MLHVERERKINGSPYYDLQKRFTDYGEAEGYFNSIVPQEGERWWLEYSSTDDAQMLAWKGQKLTYE